MAYKEAVKKLRLKMLMTQEEFAKLLDVSFATINRWETGKYEVNSKSWTKVHTLLNHRLIKDCCLYCIGDNPFNFTVILFLL